MVAILTNNDKFSIFKIGDLQIKFKTSPSYKNISLFSNGTKAILNVWQSILL